MKVSEHYTNPIEPASYSGVSSLIKAHPKKDKKFAIKEIETLKSYVLHKPIRKKFKRREVFVPFMNHQWVGDLIDVQKLAKLNSGVRYILLVIDAFSKKLYYALLRDKSAQSALNGFKRIIRESGVVPKYVQTDKGKEFENSQVQSYFKQIDVKWFHTHTKIKASLVERAIRTIMTKLARFFTHTGSKKYIEVFPKLVASSNDTYHTSIKMSQNQVTEQNQGTVLLNLYNQKKKVSVAPPKFKAGDSVIISKEKALFTKCYAQNWTTSEFKVRKVKKTVPVTYLLETSEGDPIEGGFYEIELSSPPK